MTGLDVIANPIGALAPKTGIGQFLDPAGALSRKIGGPVGKLLDPAALLKEPDAIEQEAKKRTAEPVARLLTKSTDGAGAKLLGGSKA